MPALPATFIQSRLDLHLIRWSLVGIFLGFGFTKWFEYEARALVPLIANSPLLSWLHGAFGIRGASYALGIAETATGLLLAAGSASARAGLAGALLSCATFAVTSSLLLTTPGVFEGSVGPPALGGAGAFLVKDIVLLAASFTLLREAAERFART
ncbi:DUF417 family protein [Muricoccus radiodurans]|uniref:DUF417 family protein n=1 Tax=Muricoccus radiodurans TaxID=2231721 RepID=UPI003CEF0662